MGDVRVAFGMQPVALPIDRILLSRKTPACLVTSRKYRQILASIQEVGLIEPLSVARLENRITQYLLLDGHVRLVALREMGHEAALCLVSTDDEAYTYNNRVNRLSTIQEHLMICRAIERGVSEERLAKVLNLDISMISKKRRLLDGVCAEATELLKDSHFCVDVARCIKKMKPTRQVECVELMISANNLTSPYAEALLLATTPSLLVKPEKPKKLAGVPPEQVARMERELDSVQGQYRLIEQSYGQDVLNLVIARGYLSKLLENSPVTRYLKQHQPEMFEQLCSIVEATALDR
jgi:hypothetical protein